MLLENSLYNSIYSQTGKKQTSNRSNSNTSGEKSASPSQGEEQSRFDGVRPSYAEPTRKDLQPRKELNKPKIAKALEQLRLE